MIYFLKWTFGVRVLILYLDVTELINGAKAAQNLFCKTSLIN